MRPVGTFAEALSAVPPSGVGPSAAAPDPTEGRPEAVPGRGRPCPHPARAASKLTVLARLRSFIILNEGWWLPHGFRLDPERRTTLAPSVHRCRADPSEAASAVLRLSPGCLPWCSGRGMATRLMSRTVAAEPR